MSDEQPTYTDGDVNATMLEMIERKKYWVAQFAINRNHTALSIIIECEARIEMLKWMLGERMWWG